MSKCGIVDAFYKTGAWKECRKGFIKMRGGNCERCAARGEVTAGAEVHHKKRLNKYNITDPNITLNYENLELLCERCHRIEHGKQEVRTDANGHVEI